MNQNVKLNVGGRFFETTIGTLTSHDGMLKNLFKDDFEIKKDSDGKCYYSEDKSRFETL